MFHATGNGRSAASASMETSRPKNEQTEVLQAPVPMPKAHKTYDLIANLMVETLKNSSETSTKRCRNLKAVARLATVLGKAGNCIDLSLHLLYMHLEAEPSSEMTPSQKHSYMNALFFTSPQTEQTKIQDP